MLFETKTFSELTKDELYELLKLRLDVFIVEQNCAYSDIDGKDPKALHILGKKNGVIVAYARIFDAHDYFELPSIGRVVVKQSERQSGCGHNLMRYSIQATQEVFGSSSIKIGAQTYLKKFYESHSFEQIGEEYLEDGIPHIDMIRNRSD